MKIFYCSLQSHTTAIESVFAYNTYKSGSQFLIETNFDV